MLVAGAKRSQHSVVSDPLVESLIHGLLLGSADPAHTTVAAIAHRWGFTHLGRFAAAHKKKFGNTPVQALHAAR